MIATLRSCVVRVVVTGEPGDKGGAEYTRNRPGPPVDRNRPPARTDRCRPVLGGSLGWCFDGRHRLHGLARGVLRRLGLLGRGHRAHHHRHRERPRVRLHLADQSRDHVRVVQPGRVGTDHHLGRVPAARRHGVKLERSAADDRQPRHAGHLDLERVGRNPRQQRQLDLERLPDVGLGQHVVLQVHRGGGLARRHRVRHALVVGILDHRRRGGRIARCAVGSWRGRGGRDLFLAPPASGEHGGERDNREDAGGATGSGELNHGRCFQDGVAQQVVAQPVMLTVMQVRPRRAAASALGSTCDQS